MAVDSSENIYLAGVTYSFGVGEGDMILMKYGIEKREKAPAIPGYPLSLLICVIGVITAICLKKKLKVNYREQ